MNLSKSIVETDQRRPVLPRQQLDAHPAQSPNPVL